MCKFFPGFKKEAEIDWFSVLPNKLVEILLELYTSTLINEIKVLYVLTAYFATEINDAYCLAISSIILNIVKRAHDFMFDRKYRYICLCLNDAQAQ